MQCRRTTAVRLLRGRLLPAAIVLWAFVRSPARAQTAEAIHAAAQAGDSLFGMGPFGALLVLLLLAGALAIIMLWRELQKAREQIAQLYKSQTEDGKEDTKALATSIADSRASIATFTTALGSLTEVSRDVVDTLRPLAAGIDVAIKNQDEIRKSIEQFGKEVASVQSKIDALLGRRTRP